MNSVAQEHQIIRPSQGRHNTLHEPRVSLRFTRGYYYLSPTGFKNTIAQLKLIVDLFVAL